jgi:ribosomal protein S18 acetylase RimI-like enzyme
VLPVLPRLFLDLFWATSLVAAAAAPASPAGFLVGVLSPSDPAEAYIHFVGVAPAARGSGLGRRLYERFLENARADGRTVVRAITSPANHGSVAFHRALGFAVTGPVEGHNGPGTSYLLFERRLP